MVGCGGGGAAVGLARLPDIDVSDQRRDPGDHGSVLEAALPPENEGPAPPSDAPNGVGELAVLPRDVGQAGDGCLPADGGVGPVVVVVVDPCWQSVPAGSF